MRARSEPPKPVLLIPTEADEQRTLVAWLELKRFPYFHVPNETYTASWHQKNLNKQMGVKSGVPDLFIFVVGRLVAIELKRRKNGYASPAQKEWIELLNTHGVDACVCKGAEEAIDWLESLIKRR